MLFHLVWNVLWMVVRFAVLLRARLLVVTTTAKRLESDLSLLRVRVARSARLSTPRPDRHPFQQNPFLDIF